MKNTKVYKNTRPYNELFHAHRIELRRTIDGKTHLSYAELIEEGAKAQKRLENPQEEYWETHDYISAIQDEMGKFHRNLCWQQYSQGVSILDSIDSVEEDLS